MFFPTVFVYIFLNIGKRVCEFGPFQVIPYRQNAPATEFSYSNHSVKLKFCRLPKSTKPKVKFPDYSREMEIEWLNGSYFNFTMSGNMLSFKVRKFIAVFRFSSYI